MTATGFQPITIFEPITVLKPILRKWTLDHLAKLAILASWPVWLNGWLFVYKLSDCWFESRCRHQKMSCCWGIYHWINVGVKLTKISFSSRVPWKFLLVQVPVWWCTNGIKIGLPTIPNDDITYRQWVLDKNSNCLSLYFKIL